jgi:hypothetical protein
VIRSAAGCYARDRLLGYTRQLTSRFRPSPVSTWLARAGLPAWLMPLVPRLIDVPLLARHLVLDRMFLQAHTPALHRA